MEALCNGDTVRMDGAPLSPTLSPFVPHGERETEVLLVAAVAAHPFVTIGRARLSSARPLRVRTSHGALRTDASRLLLGAV